VQHLFLSEDIMRLAEGVAKLTQSLPGLKMPL